LKFIWQLKKQNRNLYNYGFRTITIRSRQRP
jgi:hypothetical protein